MSSINDFPARGKIVEVHGKRAVFNPSGTTYQIHLEFTGEGELQISAHPIEILIQVRARKVYTVPSGGNFIAPIFGPPRTIQGRVRYASDTQLIVHAGVPHVLFRIGGAA